MKYVSGQVVRVGCALLMCGLSSVDHDGKGAMAGQTDEARNGSTMASITVNESGTLNGVAIGQENGATDPAVYAYRPEGRRDPFLAIVQDANKAVEVNLSVPPLQRVNLSEITLIGIMWGSFGYIGMVQTPDGRGYTVREGTNVGSNEGVVRLITAEGLIVREPYVDVVGRKEMREHVIPLHPKINNE